MKSVLVLIISAFILSCSNGNASKESAEHKFKVDTIKTAGKYKLGFDIRETEVWKIVKDSVFDVADSSDKDKIVTTKKWSTKVDYYIPLLDTFRINGKAAMDSSGKPRMEIKFWQLDSKFIIEDYHLTKGKRFN